MQKAITYLMRLQRLVSVIAFSASGGTLRELPLTPLPNKANITVNIDATFSNS